MAGITNEEIARINELYHKSKGEGLTESEKEEQRELRGKYIASMRESLRGQLNNIDIQNIDGSVEHVGDRIKKEKRHDN